MLQRAPTSSSTAWHIFSVSDALKDGDNEVVQAPISIVLTDISQVMPEAALKMLVWGFSFVYFCLFDVFISGVFTVTIAHTFEIP